MMRMIKLALPYRDTMKRKTKTKNTLNHTVILWKQIGKWRWVIFNNEIENLIILHWKYLPNFDADSFHILSPPYFQMWGKYLVFLKFLIGTSLTHFGTLLPDISPPPSQDTGIDAGRWTATATRLYFTWSHFHSTRVQQSKQLSGKYFHLSICLSLPEKTENGYADGLKNISPGRKGWKPFA